ncbi:MAG: surface protein [Saprospiraceae bacterium]|jgi:surface protein
MKRLLQLLVFLIPAATYSQTPITDANIRAAVDICLITNPVDGMCTSSEYGSMPDWDVSDVTNMDNLFQNQKDFNADISGWDVSNVTSMKEMFSKAQFFDEDISGWDVGKVTQMGFMFRETIFFDADISEWDVSNVTQMGFMFNRAKSFNADISNWDVANVINMENMFNLAQSFNADIGGWDVGNVTFMFGMFTLAQSFNGDISEWDVGKVTNMSRMFLGAQYFNANLNEWNVSNVISMSEMFNDSGLSSENYDETLNGWSELGVKSNVKLQAKDTYYCFGAEARQSLIDNYNWDITDAGYNCGPVNVKDENRLDVSIYPNPASYHLLINGNNSELKATVCDVIGKEIIQLYISNEIDISYLEKGVYFIHLSDGLKASSHKFFKI